MRVSETVRGYLEHEGRCNVIATTDSSGRVDVAMFGSLRLSGDDTAMIMLGDNRTWENLNANPHAACMVTMHGKTGLASEGCRLYLKVRSMEDSGEKVEAFRSEIRKRIGGAADMLRHLVLFDIVEARPILDLGQGI